MDKTAYELKKYVPGLGQSVGIVGDELKLVEINGSGTATAVAASSSVDVVIGHQPLVLNVMPEVSTATAGATVDVKSVKADSFTIVVNNTTASALDINYTYTRTGL
jgi:ABC-type tungstate transport system permease subunit